MPLARPSLPRPGARGAQCRFHRYPSAMGACYVLWRTGRVITGTSQCGPDLLPNQPDGSVSPGKKCNGSSARLGVRARARVCVGIQVTVCVGATQFESEFEFELALESEFEIEFVLEIEFEFKSEFEIDLEFEIEIECQFEFEIELELEFALEFGFQKLTWDECNGSSARLGVRGRAPVH